jgi:hypothetical protein
MPDQSVLAATLVEPGKYELREYPLPEPAPSCVLVKMEMSGICGTDKHTYQGFTTRYAGVGGASRSVFPLSRVTKTWALWRPSGETAITLTSKASRLRSGIALWSAPTSPVATATTVATISLTTFVKI